jgi:hypothetical protein
VSLRSVVLEECQNERYSLQKQSVYISSLNVFDVGAVLLRSIIWTLSIVSMFCKHNISREEPSLETLCVQNIGTMDKVQIIDRNNPHPIEELQYEISVAVISVSEQTPAAVVRHFRRRQSVLHADGARIEDVFTWLSVSQDY